MAVVGELDGTWTVRRVDGLLPPMVGVRKVIRGGHGETRLGPLAVPFVVDGTAFRYGGLFGSFVDLVDEIDDDRARGRATFRGSTFGRFEMSRRPERLDASERIAGDRHV